MPKSTTPKSTGTAVSKSAILTYDQFLLMIRTGACLRAEDIIAKLVDGVSEFSEDCNVSELLADLDQIKTNNFTDNANLWRLLCREGFFRLSTDVQDVLVISVSGIHKIWLDSRDSE